MITRLPRLPNRPPIDASSAAAGRLGRDVGPRTGAESGLSPSAAWNALPRSLPRPLPADGLTALRRLLGEIGSRCGAGGAAVQALLPGLHRSLALLLPGYPAASAPAPLWGFGPAPAGSLDELDAHLNRLEDVLLQLLPTADGAEPAGSGVAGSGNAGSGNNRPAPYGSATLDSAGSAVLDRA